MPLDEYVSAGYFSVLYIIPHHALEKNLYGCTNLLIYELNRIQKNEDLHALIVLLNNFMVIQNKKNAGCHFHASLPDLQTSRPGPLIDPGNPPYFLMVRSP